LHMGHSVAPKSRFGLLRTLVAVDFSLSCAVCNFRETNPTGTFQESQSKLPILLISTIHSLRVAR
jgi:hypothetical protein